MSPDLPSDPMELSHAATDHATFVVVPERRMFAIDGVGDPTSDGYRLASVALRTVAEMVRARLVRDRAVRTRVGVLECAWWTHPELSPAETAAAFADRSTWHWQQMIEIPGQATDADAEATIDAARNDAGREAPLVRLIRFPEGRSAQVLHVGGSVDEAASVRRLYEAVDRAGLRPRGHLHELHLTGPEAPGPRRRSILRLPIEQA